MKSIWTKIEDLKNIKVNFLPVYDDRYIKTEITTFDDYANHINKFIQTFVA